MEKSVPEHTTTPTVGAARSITELVSGHPVAAIQRFQTGAAHWVYEVRFADGAAPLVARLTRPEFADSFRGALYWYPHLEARGVPLAQLVYAEPDAAVHGFPIMLLERLAGRDLGDVYTSLTTAQRLTLARDIATFQRRVQTMPTGPGFGYASSYEDSSLSKHWFDVVTTHLERSRTRMTNQGLVTESLIHEVGNKLSKYKPYFDAVSPTPFLDDTTTKNVIIENGNLSGVVDVDNVCFGDVTQLLGLIKMAVLSLGGSLDYVEELARELRISQEQHSMIDVYALLYGVDFLTASGHKFNKDEAPTPERLREERIENTVRDLLATV